MEAEIPPKDISMAFYLNASEMFPENEWVISSKHIPLTLFTEKKIDSFIGIEGNISMAMQDKNIDYAMTSNLDPYYAWESDFRTYFGDPTLEPVDFHQEEEHLAVLWQLKEDNWLQPSSQIASTNGSIFGNLLILNESQSVEFSDVETIFWVSNHTDTMVQEYLERNDGATVETCDFSQVSGFCNIEDTQLTNLFAHRELHLVYVNTRKRESIYPLVQEPKRNGKDMSEAMVKDAVLAETSRLTSLKALALAHPKPFIATGLAVLVLTAGTVVFYDSIFGEEVPDYTLIDFDPSVARAFAQGLVDLGHPQWEGRMSGSEQEMLTSESIMDNFLKWAIKLNSIPSMYLCSVSILNPSSDIAPRAPLVKPAWLVLVAQEDVNEQSFFEHRSEFVIQGYSGSIQLNGFEDAPLVDLGHVNDENIDWASASGGIILISAGGDSSQNAIVWENGPTNGALGAIMVNEEYNCDKLVQGDCVPIFKAGIYSRIIAANQGQVPEDFPYFCCQKCRTRTT